MSIRQKSRGYHDTDKIRYEDNLIIKIRIFCKTSLNQNALCKPVLYLKRTVSLAGVVHFDKVLGAAAFVGAFGVVTDVRTDAELLALVHIC